MSTTAAASPPYAIPTESSSGRTRSASGPVELDLYVQDVAGLAAVLQVAPPPAGLDHFRYRADRYPQIGTSSDRSWLEATFVIDHDAADVARLHAEWIAGADTPATRAGLVSFVSDRMRGSHDRGFDVASVVARRLEGDCTEYAVLTASLARRAGLPARVADGVALIQGPDQSAGMGHAWTEILEDGRWVVADAALHGFQGPVTYLPYGVLEDEGPGYMVELMSRTPRWIRRIVVINGEDPAGSPAGGAELEHP